MASQEKTIILKSMDEKPPLLESLIFKNRLILLIIFTITTFFLGYKATDLQLDASFEKMIPTKHPFIVNYLAHKQDLKGFGNVIRVAVETTKGDIFTKEYMETLRKITDEIFFIPGVERGAIQGLWTPNTRWIEVTEEGFEGAAVIPDDYDGSPATLEQVKKNLLKARIVGSLVANNFKSTIVNVPLMDINPDTGKPLSYREFSNSIEKLVRKKFQSDTIKIHMVGFAKVMGDMLAASREVAIFFAVTILITMVILLAYTRCLRSALVLIVCSIVAAVWQLGILRIMHLDLDPYSMLVPFLIFAIGVSHGVQILSGIHRESAKGADRLQAARLTFRRIYKPGLTALITDGIGFATMAVIQVTVIQYLALGASIGVIILIVTNLVMLPIMVSYLGVSRKQVEYQQQDEMADKHPIWGFLAKMTGPKTASVAVLVAGGLFIFGIVGSKNLKIGDLDPGAPELRPNSRYNLDNAFMGENYSSSSDLFVVMVKTPPEKNSAYANMVAMEQLQLRLEQLPGVQSTSSLVDEIKTLLVGFNEGNLKWKGLPRNQQTLNASAVRTTPIANNREGTLSPIIIYLKDHKAETLQAVVNVVNRFAYKNITETSQFLMAAGNAGIEAATNIVISKAQYKMLIWVYGIVAGLCLLTFRSVGAMVAIILPLMLTSALCQLVMMWLGIGVKVATLPVIALGVGVGVDYGIYIYSQLQSYLSDGLSLSTAYYRTVITTGKAVILIGLMLAVGVATWAFSPIKFQADMGILLTFMFLVNMIGAIVLLPALASLLVRYKRRSAKIGSAMAA
ncbi:MAG: MMPL family transporter [Desulfobacterales bacterium]|jgi:predicted RND superfamily exporter protein|nr:MMPL family transporter [Desulfobacterales bacterium]